MPLKAAGLLFKTSSMSPLIPADYANWLASLKEQIRGARLKAGLAVNHELVLLYRQIGKDILDRQ